MRNSQYSTAQPAARRPAPDELPLPVTDLLGAWAAGELRARDEVVEHVYDELRRLAARRMRPEVDDPALQPTAVAHEAYLRLAAVEKPRWANREHFLAVAAKTVRSVIVDYARARGRQRRGGAWARVDLVEELIAGAGASTDLFALAQALERLGELSPRQASVVEMHFFAGLSVAETAAALGCGTATVTRDWRMARAWLSRELREGAPSAAEANRKKERR